MSWHDDNARRITDLHDAAASLPEGQDEAAASYAVARATYEVAIAIRDVGGQLVRKEHEGEWRPVQPRR